MQIWQRKRVKSIYIDNCYDNFHTVIVHEIIDHYQYTITNFSRFTRNFEAKASEFFKNIEVSHCYYIDVQRHMIEVKFFNS